MHYVYILERSDWKWYYWSTSSITRRLQQHNRWYVKSTKYYRPLKLIKFKIFWTKTEAENFEKYIKLCKNKNYIKKLTAQWKNTPN